MHAKLAKRMVSLVTAVIILSTLLIGCGGGAEEASNENSTKENVSAATANNEKTQDTEKTAEKKPVDFWYLWGGAEQPRVESFISAFNESQKEYEVKGLYIADMQKVKVAIAGGTGPDITDDFDGNVASYAEEGILEPLDSYIERDGVKFDDYVSGVLDTCKYNGKIYALPAGITFFMLYYNKALLEKAGYKEPPKTQTELLEMSIKTTELEADQSIKVLGFPDFPYVYYLKNFVFASGGQFYDGSGRFTPDHPAVLSAVNMMIEYRKKFGVDNVLKFNQAGKVNEATDPFITGNQVFRIDGLWLANAIINQLKIGKEQLDFGICPIPYPEGKPELANSAQISSSIFYIPSNAKNKEGAWELMKFIHTGEFNKYMQSLPVVKSLMGDAAFKDIPRFSDFAEFAKVGKFAALPANSKAVEIFKLFDDQVELAVTLKKTPEEALKEAAEKGNEILGNQ